MTDRELLEYLARHVGEISSKMDLLGADISQVKTTVGLIETRVSSIEARIVGMENAIGLKLSALLDAYKLNSEELDVIQAEVADHRKLFYVAR